MVYSGFLWNFPYTVFKWVVVNAEVPTISWESDDDLLNILIPA